MTCPPLQVKMEPRSGIYMENAIAQEVFRPLNGTTETIGGTNSGNYTEKADFPRSKVMGVRLGISEEHNCLENARLRI